MANELANGQIGEIIGGKKSDAGRESEKDNGEGKSIFQTASRLIKTLICYWQEVYLTEETVLCKADFWKT